MFTKIGKSLMLASSALALTGTAFAQDSTHKKVDRVTPFNGVKDYRTWSVGVWGGGSAAFGPVGGPYYFNNFDFNNAGLVYGGYIKKQIFHNFGLQADFMRGQVKGSTKASQTLAGGITSFKTDIDWSASVSGVFSLGSINWLNKQSYIIPYVSAGAGAIGFKPSIQAGDGSATPVLNSDGSNTHRELFIPVGVGAKFNVARGVNIDLAYTANFVNSKVFDGVNSGNKDKFSTARLGVEFALGNKKKPQLAVVNPAAQATMDLMDKNAALKNSLTESDARNQAAISQLQGEIAAMKQDTDGDGVPDFLDKCPNTPAGTKVDGSGCPLPTPVQVVKEKIIVTDADKKVVKDAIDNLEFDLGKATIRPTSFSSLDKVAALLVEKNFSLKLAGHTDNTGSAATNMRLSKGRAEAIKSYLVSKGANPSRIEATGYGSNQPIASNKTAAGRQQNRRVEFTLY
ncbi:OmpA family protein [Chitinophaga nivalis]|uniref:OmpA family protein n=1 Tax=Chitinophaga nivalis TaxID=2991709 RepID=A0ABT3INF3_9BACT|nr:OmpA family protein [Chitinophaga nivalis]MCW3464832.1 OmpA family protein [Chitinophaga nivalis]MCW3485477.1 OmpA family protein [Chitinophaga nivalis]